MAEEIINKVYVDDFVSIAGSEPMLDAITMFGSSVMEYIGNCKEFFARGAYEDAGKEVHKIKGAASSIGLNRMMVDAKKLELELLAQRADYPLDEKLNNLQKIAAEDAYELMSYLKSK